MFHGFLFVGACIAGAMRCQAFNQVDYERRTASRSRSREWNIQSAAVRQNHVIGMYTASRKEWSLKF